MQTLDCGALVPLPKAQASLTPGFPVILGLEVAKVSVPKLLSGVLDLLSSPLPVNSLFSSMEVVRFSIPSSIHHIHLITRLTGQLQLHSAAVVSGLSLGNHRIGEPKLYVYNLKHCLLAPSGAQEVTMLVRSFGPNLSRALNLHLSLSGQSQVSPRSVLGQSQISLRSQVSLRSVSGQSQVSLRSVLGLP